MSFVLAVEQPLIVSVRVSVPLVADVVKSIVLVAAFVLSKFAPVPEYCQRYVALFGKALWSVT